MIGMIMGLYFCYAYIFAGNGLTDSQSATLVLAIMIEIMFEGALVMFLQIRKGYL